MGFELAKLAKLVRAFQQRQSKNLVELLTLPAQPAVPLPAALDKAKSELYALKNMLSDLYAEQCGSVCVNQ